MAWFLDNRNLSSLAWNVKNRSAGWSVPARKGSNINIPNRHGTMWTPNKKFEPGFLTLSMWAVGSNPDGSLPEGVDAKRKVRDNLDELTSLFTSAPNRLHILRQITGSDVAMVNEIDNPLMSSSSGRGTVLAVNAVVDASDSARVATVVSNNIHSNPLVKGSGGTVRIGSEDLYPDPALMQHAKDREVSLFNGYYFPITQDYPSYNNFWEPYNNFAIRTGVNGRGEVSHPYGAEWDGSSWVGMIHRRVYQNRERGVVFMARLRLDPAFSGSSLDLRVSPLISTDGQNWSEGTGVDVVATKNYTWVVVTPDKLPSYDPSRDYHVGYRIQIVGGATIRKGANFNIDRMTIQDAPAVGNPWRDKVNSTHLVVGAETPYVWYTGEHGRSWTTFKRAPAPEWEVVHTSSTATTAPYAYAWSDYDSDRREGWLAFTVFGGARNTFRRVLPVPTLPFSDTRIWGKAWNMTTNGYATIRVLERTGSEGSYSYTPVGSVTVDSNQFISDPFEVKVGSQYVMEIDVPQSDSGFEPAIFFRELHVSNGKSDTIERDGGNSNSGTIIEYPGMKYDSSIVSFVYNTPGFVVGDALPAAPRWNASGVKWASQPSGVLSVAGKVSSEKMTIPTSYKVEDLTFNLNVRWEILPHAEEIVRSLPARNLQVEWEFFDASGASVRKVQETFSSVTGIQKSFTTLAEVQEGERSVQIHLSSPNSRPGLVEYRVSKFAVMSNMPQQAIGFDGSNLDNRNATWPYTVSWDGVPYFSTSTLRVPLSPRLVFPRVTGFDADRSIRTTGNSVTASVVLEEGTAVVGIRRGDHTTDFTVSVKATPESTPVSLGTITSTKDFAQGEVPIPSGGTTELEFVFTYTGEYVSIKDVHALQKVSPLFPVDLTQWIGFTENGGAPELTLQRHPSSIVPMFSAVRRTNGTVAYETGAIDGWQGQVVGGGYIGTGAEGTHIVASTPIPVSGGFVSGAFRVMPMEDMPEGSLKAVLQLMGDDGVWRTAKEATVTTTEPGEVVVTDAAVEDAKFVRLGMQVDSSFSRRGVAAILYGATVVVSPFFLGVNFPGYFRGIRSSTGDSEYRGFVRQCFVEVTEAIDMNSSMFGQIAEFAVNLTVPGSFWEDVYDTSFTISTTDAEGEVYLMELEGATAPMDDSVIEIVPRSGSLTRIKLTDRGSGEVFEWKGPATKRLVLDTDKFSVVSSDGTSSIKNVVQSGTSSLLPITPHWRSVGEILESHIDGVPVFDYESNVPVNLNVSARRKYLIA